MSAVISIRGRLGAKPTMRQTSNGGKQRMSAIMEGVTNPNISVGLHPYRYRFKNGKGGGTYLTPAATLTEARAELLRRWPDELLVVMRGCRR